MANTNKLFARRQERVRVGLRRKSVGRPRPPVPRPGPPPPAQIIDAAAGNTLAAASTNT